MKSMLPPVSTWARKVLPLALAVPVLCSADELPADGAPPVLAAPAADLRPLTMAPARPAFMMPESVTTSGFIRNSSFNLLMKNYSNVQQVDDVLQRHAWVQSMEAALDSGYTGGKIGVGISIAPFMALNLDRTSNAGNMSTGAESHPEAFLGAYTLNARAGDSVIKYGLQRVSNPVLESRDTRALPPTFRGVSLASKLSDTVLVDAGSFDRVLARGQTGLRRLSTSSGGVEFDRLNYAGIEWAHERDGKLALYVNQASNVWNQGFAALEKSLAGPGSIVWKAASNAYYTRGSGARRQGDIDNKAFSLALGGTRERASVVLSYQRVIGDQYFDYVDESWGDSMANSAADDYNLPHERSLQLRYKFAGARDTLPGLKMDVWVIHGWGADTSASARLYPAATDALHSIYWKNNAAISGSHHEIGTFIRYLVPSGQMKGALVTLFGVVHKGAPTYLDRDWHEARLTVSFPLRVF